jgi:hypothetical protein
LKYPDFEIRRFICKFRLSDHSLEIETGRYKKIPRHLRTCNKCETLDDEYHFFLNCKLNEHLRKAFLSDFDNTNKTNLLEIILNPTNINQVKSLGSFIKQSMERRTWGTWFHLFYCVLNLFIMLYIVCLCIVDYSMYPLTLIRVEIVLNKVIIINITLVLSVEPSGEFRKNIFWHQYYHLLPRFICNPLKIKTTKCQHVFHFLFALGKIIILAHLDVTFIIKSNVSVK